MPGHAGYAVAEMSGDCSSYGCQGVAGGWGGEASINHSDDRVEEEVVGNSSNVMAKEGHPKRPAALPLPVPKRKPTFSAPFKKSNGTAPPSERVPRLPPSASTRL